MNVIYEPKGRAREYAPLACNLYMGCTHGCKYCYAPACMHKKPEEWHQAARARGENVLELFERDCARLAKERADDETRRVLFCFLSDPYQPLESELHLTRRGISVAARHGPLLVLGALTDVQGGHTYTARCERAHDKSEQVILSVEHRDKCAKQQYS
jgi:DNA repair photolyase